MEPVRLVAFRNDIVGNKLHTQRGQPPFRFRCPCQILGVRFLEEPSVVRPDALRIGVFDGEHPVAQRPTIPGRHPVLLAAMGTRQPATGHRSIHAKLDPAASAPARSVDRIHLGQLATGMADEDIPRMPAILSEEIAGEQVDILSAAIAAQDLDPEEILHRHRIRAVNNATRGVEVSNLLLERRPQAGCRGAVGIEINVVELLADDPPRHRIDVETEDLAAQPVGLKDRSTAAHKRIGDADPVQPVRAIERLPQWGVGELRQQEPPEERARPPGEPFVDRDDWTIVLLNLLLPQGEVGDERNIEVFLDHGGSWDTNSPALSSCRKPPAP